MDDQKNRGKLSGAKSRKRSVAGMEEYKKGSLDGWKEKITLNEKLGLRFRSTQDIIEAAECDLLPDRIMITVHPQRWSDSFVPWIRELVFQNVKNVGKVWNG